MFLEFITEFICRLIYVINIFLRHFKNFCHHIQKSFNNDMENPVFLFQRSVDEEKREHGDKVSKLLDWMSNVKHSINQDGSGLKDSNANTGASNKSQVCMYKVCIFLLLCVNCFCFFFHFCQYDFCCNKTTVYQLIQLIHMNYDELSNKWHIF